MHVPSVPTAVPQPALRGHRATPRRHSGAGRLALAVDTIGHLVPRTGFSGRVHSVFARACNIARDGTWLTLCAAGAGDGPAMLRLAQGTPHDLRDLFEAGECVHAGPHGLCSSRVELLLQGARVWRPAACRAARSPLRIDAHLRRAGARLQQRRGTRSSVIDREAAPVAAALVRACGALDGEQVERQADRLLGWGEGLTPAGDDFLIGLLAGLDAFVCADVPRLRLRDALAAALVAGLQRTTPIAAHYLRLAAAGHYNESLLRLRHALLCEDDAGVVDAALHDALAVGATSGADTASGLIAGLRVWLPAPMTV